jgi:Tol biopolymer transport system component
MEKKIAFSRGSTIAGGINIYVISVRGGTPIQLTKSTDRINLYPAWSPDDKKIAFASAPLISPMKFGQFDIYVINADGSNLTRLTSEGGEYPTWSPDGKKIAFQSKRDGKYWIFIMDADGSNQTRLIEGIEPDWSPDGKKIAFVNADWPRKIGVINVDGSGLVWLTDPPEISLTDGRVTHAKDEYPKWSPDGEKIAFASTRSGNWDIYLINADGSNITRLTDDPENDIYPSWSPL